MLDNSGQLGPPGSAPHDASGLVKAEAADPNPDAPQVLELLKQAALEPYLTRIHEGTSTLRFVLGSLATAVGVVLLTVLGVPIGLPNAAVMVLISGLVALWKTPRPRSIGRGSITTPEWEKIRKIREISAQQRAVLDEYIEGMSTTRNLPQGQKVIVEKLLAAIRNQQLSELGLPPPAASPPAAHPPTSALVPTPAPPLSPAMLTSPRVSAFHDEFFADAEDLFSRLLARSSDCVYLVGSAITAPQNPGGHGVPGVAGIIDLIRDEFSRLDDRQRFERALEAEPENHYQAAFRFLHRTRDQDLANAIIRRAVLAARRRSARFPDTPRDVTDLELLQRIEDDDDGWHLPDAAAALGRVLAHQASGTKPVVLTSNFDPLVTVAIRRAGGQAYSTALAADGSLAGIAGAGAMVVHFHGHWFRTDTLHTQAQLGQDRPRLGASLGQLLADRTLVVIGYSGWDDVFTTALVSLVRAGATLKVAWAFYPSDKDTIVQRSGRLLDQLRPAMESRRITLYKGIDAHEFLPRLADELALRVAP